MSAKIKNLDLYHAWLAYYERTTSLEPCERRSLAYFNSQKGQPVPLR